MREEEEEEEGKLGSTGVGGFFSPIFFLPPPLVLGSSQVD